MTPESWKRLEAEAQLHLEHADQSPPVEPLRGMALHLRLWHYPRSGAHMSWSIIVPVREFRARSAVLRETAWDRSADRRQRLSPLRRQEARPTPGPSVHIRDAEMDWTDLEPFLDAAGGLPIGALGQDPAIPSEEGASGLMGYRSLAHVRLEWAGKGPPGWRSTIAWVLRLRKALVSVMKNQRTGSREG